jgi:hypothetical protein
MAEMPLRTIIVVQALAVQHVNADVGDNRKDSNTADRILFEVCWIARHVTKLLQKNASYNDIIHELHNMNCNTTEAA